MSYQYDFGSLSLDEEMRYIKVMTENLEFYNKDILIKMIAEVHNFIKDVEDSSGASLRDIKRFIIVYSWFHSNLKNRQVPFKLSSKSEIKTDPWGYWIAKTDNSQSLPEKI